MNITLAAVIMTAYVVFVCAWARCIPNSMSQSVFLLPSWGRTLWTVAIAVVAFLTVPSFIDHTPDDFKFLAFLSCAALAFVAVTPLTGAKEMSYNVHMISAYACGVLSQLAVAITCPWFLLLWLPWVVAYVLIRRNGQWKTKAFWAEVTCFVSVFFFCLL